MLNRFAKLLTAGRGQRHVAVALRKGKVLAIGRNSYTKTHPKQKHHAVLAGQPKKEYLHAEIAALLRCTGVPDTLVVLRRDKAGVLVNSRPCSVCLRAISSVNPSMKVIHS